jgi:hypothetical protein
MDDKKRNSGGGTPPSNYIAAAIRNLPRAGPDVGPQIVEINAGPTGGRFRVEFVVRRNPDRQVPAWFWGVESSERLTIGQAGTETP